MAKISLCMIVKNEERFLEACLKSIKSYVDEIIIVDTGSKDKTKEIAKKFTDKLYDFKWDNNFSKPRNYSLKKATKEWILVLDADEIIAEEDLKKIKKLIQKTEYDAFYLIQRNYTDDSSLSKWTPIKERKYKESKKYKGYVKNPIMRLFRNKDLIKYEGVVHEIVDNSVKKNDLKYATLDIPLHHYTEEKKKNSLKERQLKYLEIAEKKIKEKPNGRLYSTAGAINLYFKKDYEKALYYFKKAVEMDYKTNENKEGMAECYIKMKQYKKAYHIYNDLVKKGYLTPSLCNNMGNILVMYKHYKSALKFLKLALAKGNPNKERILENIKTIEKRIKKD